MFKNLIFFNKTYILFFKIHFYGEIVMTILQ